MSKDRRPSFLSGKFAYLYRLGYDQVFLSGKFAYLYRLGYDQVFLSGKFAYLYRLGYEHSKSSHNPDRRTLLYVLLFA